MTETLETREFELHGHKFIARFYADDDHGAPWVEEDGHGEVSEWTSRAKRPGEWTLSEERRGLKRFYDFAGAMRTAMADGWGLSADDKEKLAQTLAKPKVTRRVASSVYHVENGVRQDKLTFETVTIPGRDPAKPLTRGEIAAESVRRDYERLRGWAMDHWQYVGVSVAPMIPARDRLTSALESVLDSDSIEAAQDAARMALEADDEYAPEDYTNALWGIESDAGEYLGEVMRELAQQYIDSTH